MGQSKMETIQRNWQHRWRKTKQKHNTICVGHYYAQTNTNNVNKTWALLQTTEGKDGLEHYVNVESKVRIFLYYFQAIQGGHAILLGMSYSTGRCTLARLAAYVAHCKVRD